MLASFSITFLFAVVGVMVCTVDARLQWEDDPKHLLALFANQSRIAKAAAAAAHYDDETSHRNLQIDFNVFTQVVCVPFAQSFVDEGFDPSAITIDCFSEPGGLPPYTLQATLPPLCVSGIVLEEVWGKACPGEICSSIHIKEEWSGELLPLTIQTEYRFSGATDYEVVGEIFTLSPDDNRNYVRLKGVAYDCTEPVTVCPRLTNDEDEVVTEKFDCSNIQTGWKVTTCPGTDALFIDSFDVCPEGGAKIPGTLVVCFPGDSEVTVQDRRGPIKMKDLQLGDMVQVVGGNYEPIYSFGHKHSDTYSEFLAISTTDNKVLEISKNHMVGRPNGGFVPAGILQVGDSLISSNGVTTSVRSIRSVQRKGVYAPFTDSGTIIVNGILASTYIAYEDSQYLRIASMKTPFTYQWLAQTFQCLHRLATKLNLFGEETYSESGVSGWVQGPHEIFMWLLDQHVVVVLPVMTITILCFGFIWVVDTAAPVSLVAALLLVNAVRCRMMASSTTKKKKTRVTGN